MKNLLVLTFSLLSLVGIKGNITKIENKKEISSSSLFDQLEAQGVVAHKDSTEGHETGGSGGIGM